MFHKPAGSCQPLERLIERESLREILELLSPGELVVAVLRLEGLSDAQIGRLLNLTHSAVSHRLQRAQQRIVDQRPDLAPLLQGRKQPSQRPPSREPLPLEHGWLCRRDDEATEPPPDRGADLTTQDVAQRCDVAPQTVTRWIRAGRLPHAYRLGGRGDYRIPEGDVAGLFQT